MVEFYYVECKQSFLGCNMFTLIGYSYFGKLRRYFYNANLVSAATALFFPPRSIENCDLQMEHSIFSHLLIFL
jgi:hypothetical protein